MSPKLTELIQQAEALATEEQLQLIAHLAQKLSITTQKSQSVHQTDLETATGQSLLTMFDSLTADMTPKEIAKLPSDGAEPHDHYIYGSPKRRAEIA